MLGGLLGNPEHVVTTDEYFTDLTTGLVLDPFFCVLQLDIEVVIGRHQCAPVLCVVELQCDYHSLVH